MAAIWKEERPPAHYGVLPKQEPYWPAFRLFYARYPRKESPYSAWKAFARLKLTVKFVVETIVPSIEKHERTRQWQRGRTFVPHPSTFLNQRRWEGEPPEETPAGAAPKMDNEQHRLTPEQRAQQETEDEYRKAREHYVSLEIDRMGLEEFLDRCASEKKRFVKEQPVVTKGMDQPHLNELARRRVERQIASKFPNIARWKADRDKEKGQS